MQLAPVILECTLSVSVTYHGSRLALGVSVGRLITAGGRSAVRHPPGSYYTPPLCALGAYSNS